MEKEKLILQNLSSSSVQVSSRKILDRKTETIAPVTQMFRGWSAVGSR